MLLRQLRISPERGKVWGKQKKRKRHRREPGGSDTSGKLEKRIYKREGGVRSGLRTGWGRVLRGWLRKPLRKKSGCSELIPQGSKQGRGGPQTSTVLRWVAKSRLPPPILEISLQLTVVLPDINPTKARELMRAPLCEYTPGIIYGSLGKCFWKFSNSLIIQSAPIRNFCRVAKWI